MKNKQSISLLSLKNLSKLDEFLRLIKLNGINYIELPITKILPNYELDKKKINIFLNKINKHKIKVSSIQAIFHKKRLNVLNMKDHTKIVNHINKIISISKLLKAKNIIFGSPKNRIKGNISNKEAFKIFKNLLIKIEIRLIKNNIFFCIEPNSKHYGCDFIIKSRTSVFFIFW